AGRSCLEGRAVYRAVRRHRGRRAPPAAVAHALQDALGRPVFLRWGGMEEWDVWRTRTQRVSVIFHDNDFELFIGPNGAPRQHELVEGRYRKVAARPREDHWVWSPQGAIDIHRPERWGYVQSSTARPGRDRFRPDPTGPARDLLHQVYYAQRRYREQHARYTA